MVLNQFAVSDHVEINSPYSQYDGIHGTVVKITPKCVAVALDTAINVPLDLCTKTYVLPKHLQLLEPDSSTEDLDTLIYADSNIDPEPQFPPDTDSESDAESDYPFAKDFYSELLLLGIQFLGDIQELTRCHFGDVRNCPK